MSASYSRASSLMPPGCRVIPASQKRSELGKVLPSYEMANGQPCYYFKTGTVPDDTIDFINADGKKAWRGIVGFKSVGNDRKRIWHFA
jgi:hypothetical protein